MAPDGPQLKYRSALSLSDRQLGSEESFYLCQTDSCVEKRVSLCQSDSWVEKTVSLSVRQTAG